VKSGLSDADSSDPSALVPLVHEIDWLKEKDADNTDPHVHVTWVKKIRRLDEQSDSRWNLIHHLDEPDGVCLMSPVVVRPRSRVGLP
jgi:hypothetical protein